MRWLSRAASRISARVGNESGATLILVVVALVALLAMTAFVIDFGRIWQERRELQIGATAAALAVAEDCARGLCDAAYNEMANADTYADANAKDGAATIHHIDLDLAEQTVHVVTATENSAGGDDLDMMFARVVGFDTITVGADATVTWGAPYQLATIPIIISDCEWNHPNTDEGEDPALFPGWPGGDPDSLPDYPEDDLTMEPIVILTFHDATGTEECNAHPGQDADGDGKLPGGFGWLDTDGDCTTQVYGVINSPPPYGWVDTDPGSSPSTGCGPDELRDLLYGEPVMIPYFSDIQGVGSNGRYLIEGYGAFVVAGYNFGGQYKEFVSPLPGLPCSGSTRCLAGWFVQTVSQGGGVGGIGGEDRGVVVIQLIG